MPTQFATTSARIATGGTGERSSVLGALGRAEDGAARFGIQNADSARESEAVGRDPGLKGHLPGVIAVMRGV